MDTPVTGTPRLLLRLEGLGVFAAVIVFYQHLGFSWAAFALGFLVPDLAIAAYLAGPTIGALGYNVAHSYIGPAAALLAALGSEWTWLQPFALIWMAHIAMDRALGLGLKFRSAFGDTHLGTVGRKR